MPAILPTRVPAPKTRAMLALEQNLDSIKHTLALSHREAKAIKAYAARTAAFVRKDLHLDLAANPAQKKLLRSLGGL